MHAARPSLSQRALQNEAISVTHELRQLTCCTATPSDIDSVRVLPSTDNVICETSAGSVRNGIVVVRTKHTGAALYHVCRSVHRLPVQRCGIVEKSSLSIFVTVAIAKCISIQRT